MYTSVELYLVSMAIGLFIIAACEHGPRHWLEDVRDRIAIMGKENRFAGDRAGAMLAIPLVLTLMGYAFLKVDIQLLFVAITLVLYALLNSHTHTHTIRVYVGFVGICNSLIAAISLDGFYIVIMSAFLALTLGLLWRPRAKPACKSP